MAGLFPVAYLGELALWVPLVAIVVAVPGMRRWLAAPIGVSALAMAYEGRRWSIRSASMSSS
jgi:hypothetical protein